MTRPCSLEATREDRSWLLRLVVGALLAILAGGTLAQTTTYWDARRLLSSTSQPTLILLERDREVARVERRQLEHFVEVVDRIAKDFSIQPEVVVIKGDRPNAFATRKDGKAIVGVNVPMLNLTNADPDLSAVVVGHEIAHLQLDHLDEGRKREVAIGVLAAVVGAVAGYNVAKRGVNPASVMDLAAIGGALANRKFDRDQEREADDLGIRAMQKAGYDVHAAPRLWEKMKSYGAGGSGWWLSTHPAHDERIDSLRATAVALGGVSRAPTGVAALTTTFEPSPQHALAVAPPDDSQASRDVNGLTLSEEPGAPGTAQRAAPQFSIGSAPWCLVDPSKIALCSYQSWSDCDLVRSGSDARCRGRESLDATSAKSDAGKGAQESTAPVEATTPLPHKRSQSESIAAKRLRELQRLKDENLITDDEYQLKRKSILSDL